MTNILLILLGITILLAGRRLFWLFVGVVGFVVGISLATQVFKSESELTILAIALIAGVLGGLLAVFLQRLAVEVASFVAGGYAAIIFVDLLGLTTRISSWVPFLVGGILGAILVAALFDWALIILSSLTGAVMLVQAFKVSHIFGLLVFVVLFALGIGIQAGAMRGVRGRS